MMGIYTNLPIQLVLAGIHHRLEIVWLFGKEQLKYSFSNLKDSVTPSSFSVVDTVDLKYRLHY
jgi:hypothetical protein